MKKEQKKPLSVGDIMTVEFLRNEKGGKPICRLNGVVGFVSGEFSKFIAPRSVWEVEVVKLNQKVAHVMPLFKVKTPWENLRDIESSIKQLEKPKAERKAKPKVKYTNV